MRVLVIDENFDPKDLDEAGQNLFAAYKKALQQRSTFQKLLGIQHRHPDEFLKRCKQLAKSVTYISFRTGRKHFVVKPRVDGKLVYLGSSTDFDEATNMLKTYLENRINNN